MESPEQEALRLLPEARKKAQQIIASGREYKFNNDDLFIETFSGQEILTPAMKAASINNKEHPGKKHYSSPDWEENEYPSIIGSILAGKDDEWIIQANKKAKQAKEEKWIKELLNLAPTTAGNNAVPEKTWQNRQPLPSSNQQLLTNHQQQPADRQTTTYNNAVYYQQKTPHNFKLTSNTGSPELLPYFNQEVTPSYVQQQHEYMLRLMGYIYNQPPERQRTAYEQAVLSKVDPAMAQGLIESLYQNSNWRTFKEQMQVRILETWLFLANSDNREMNERKIKELKEYINANHPEGINAIESTLSWFLNFASTMPFDPSKPAFGAVFNKERLIKGALSMATDYMFFEVLNQYPPSM